MTDDPKNLQGDVRRVLDEQNRNLDGATLSRLSRARQKALDGRRKSRARYWGWSAVPVAAALLAVLMLRQPVTVIQPVGDEISDLQILTSEESLEFFLEDMAFYEWIEEVVGHKSVHHNDDDLNDDTDNSLVRADRFESGKDESTGRKLSAGWRAPGVFRFI